MAEPSAINRALMVLLSVVLGCHVVLVAQAMWQLDVGQVFNSASVVMLGLAYTIERWCV